MSTSTRRGAILGFLGTVLLVAGVVTAPAAHAVTWNTEAPTHATNVTTVADADLSGGGLVMIRRGTHNGRTYYWGRVSDPASTYNSGHDLRFVVGRDCVGGGSAGSRTIDINRTTYTSAALDPNTCVFAMVIKRSTGNVVKSTQYST